MAFQKAVVDNLGRLEEVTHREPMYLNSTLFTCTEEGEAPSGRGDATVNHLGRAVIVDVTLTSIWETSKDYQSTTNARSTAEKREEEKRKSLAKRFYYPPEAYTPLAVDCRGGWGPSMWKHFNEANQLLKESRSWTKRHGNYQVSEVRNVEWRWVKESISLAVCRANAVYMRACREGVLPNGLNRTQAETKTKENKQLRKDKQSNNPRFMFPPFLTPPP